MLSRVVHRTATRGNPPKSGAARPQVTVRVASAWQTVKRMNDRVEQSWCGDILAAISLAILTVGLFWGAGIAQAVWP